jgi:hypothetical protein
MCHSGYTAHSRFIKHTVNTILDAAYSMPLVTSPKSSQMRNTALLVARPMGLPQQLPRSGSFTNPTPLHNSVELAVPRDRNSLCRLRSDAVL